MCDRHVGYAKRQSASETLLGIAMKVYAERGPEMRKKYPQQFVLMTMDTCR